MSILTTTNSTQPDLLTPRASSPDLRSSSASDAPEFAQVLQVFDREERSELTQSTSADESSSDGEGEAEATNTSDSSETQNPASSDQSDQEAPAEAGTSDTTGQTDQAAQQDQAANGSATAPEPETQDSNKPINDQALPNADTEQAPAAITTDAQQNTQNQTPRQEATGLDLLNNKSDQAKLSIRGLVRAIRADASQDSTTLAVQTKLGQAPTKPSDQQSQPIQPLSAGDQTPKPVQAEQPVRTGVVDPRDALTDTPPVSDRTTPESKRTPSTPGAHLTAARDMTIEHTRPESGQTQSTRAEATVQVSASRTAEPLRADAVHSAGRSEVISRVEGALTARAVGGVDAGQARVGAEASQARAAHSLKPTPTEQQALQSKLIAQVQRGLAQLMRSATGEMTLRLSPERLGELKIEIKRSGDQLAVRLTTQNTEARELLSSGTDELTQLLRAKGVDVERVQIEQQGTSTPGQGDSDLGEQGSDEHDSGQHGSTHEQHASQDTETSLTSDQAAQSDAIWTDLGLDAIA
jgi:flagellar hook-length control protein FliK